MHSNIDDYYKAILTNEYLKGNYQYYEIRGGKKNIDH